MNIRPVGAELFLADRQTDRRTVMMKLIVTFHNFAKTPEDDVCEMSNRNILTTKTPV
jgi:hypothetical protein